MDNSYRTAIQRKNLSTPVKFLLDKGLLNGKYMLDFGCGRGTDVDILINTLDLESMSKYDPYWTGGVIYVKCNDAFAYPERDANKKYDIITCNYVLNVLPKEEWQEVLDEIYYLLDFKGVAYISVRNDKNNLNGVTKTGTYQTFVELDLPVIKRTSNFVLYKMEK